MWAWESVSAANQAPFCAQAPPWVVLDGGPQGGEKPQGGEFYHRLGWIPYSSIVLRSSCLFLEESNTQELPTCPHVLCRHRAVWDELERHHAQDQNTPKPMSKPGLGGFEVAVNYSMLKMQVEPAHICWGLLRTIYSAVVLSLSTSDSSNVPTGLALHLAPCWKTLRPNSRIPTVIEN